MVKLEFNGSSHARLYSLHRPDIPEELVDRILAYLKLKMTQDEFREAVDVGCGSGQSTTALAPFFTNVTGLDASPNQILEAERTRHLSNIRYLVSEAEKLPLEDGTAQLVTAACCLHWLDLPRFFSEARRVLSGGGVFAAYAYTRLQPLVSDPTCANAIDSLMHQTYEALQPYFSSEVQMAFRGYDDIQFPFEEVLRVRRIRQVWHGRPSSVTGFISTLSAFQKMKKQQSDKAEKLLSGFHSSLCGILKTSDDLPLPLFRDFVLVLCRKGS